MEEKKKGIIWIVLGIIFVIALIFGGIFVYISNNDEKINANEQLYKIEGIPEVVNVAVENDYLSSYIIGKYKNKYFEILKENGIINIISKDKNKIYYSTEKGIYTIDLNDNNFKKIEVVKFTNSIYQNIKLVGEDIYFLTQADKYDVEPTTNLYKININNINNKVLIKENVANYEVINNNIYYLDTFNNFKMNDILIEDNTLEVLNINNYIFNLLYENDNYYLKVYDVTNRNNTLLSTSKNMNPSISSNVANYEDVIYYVDNNKVINMNTNATIYTIENIQKINVINNEVIKIITNNKELYIKDGKEVKDRYSNISVIMKNNSTKTFNIESIK